MDSLDRRIINQLQGGFPVCERPFREAAQQLGTTESELITRLRCMLDDGLLTRFGPLFHAEQLVGALSLCAMQVPPERFDTVAEQVNAFPQVAHNYQRDHAMNMWFVLACETPEGIGQAAERRAEQWLTKAGLKLVTRNYRCRAGEIDLVMSDGSELVFVEVRCRSNPAFGGALASVDAHKQRRLVLAAQTYLLQRNWSGPCRFDVVGIEAPNVQPVWIRNAFTL